MAALSAAPSAWALTAADTTISNTATISYDVGGTTQSAIGSSPFGNTAGAGTATTFKVDRVIDLNVTKGSDVQVTPAVAASTKTITYQLTNEGNDEEQFNITFGQEAGDDFDTSSCTVTAATNSTSFTTAAVVLPKETISDVTVSCTIPAASALANDETSDLEFIATANRAQDNSNVDDADTVQTVYGDAAAGTTSDTLAKNGIFSAINTYIVDTAVLSVQKTTSVVCDPHNGTTNPKRIPGAIVKVDILVTNGVGAATASNVIITDDITANGFTTNTTYTTSAPALPSACNGATVAAAAVTTGGAGTVTGAGINTATDALVSTNAMSMGAETTATLTFYATVD